MEIPSDPGDPESHILSIIHFLLLALPTENGVSNMTAFVLSGSLILILLLFFSAFFSASENAFFSLTSSDLKEIEKKQEIKNGIINVLLSKPKILLATILVGNNLVNIAFIVFSSVFLEKIINLDLYPILEFPIKVLLVTFILLVFGEVIPKTYATKYNQQVVIWCAKPLLIFQKFFGFFIFPLSNSVSWFDKKIKINQDKISAEQLTHAIDITTETNADGAENAILKGIVNFGNTQVRQIMKPRVDVVAISNDESFSEVLEKVRNVGYSRMPVYNESFDNTIGIIYIKDLLPYINEKDTFNWRKLIKAPFYVPETKKIDDLLKDFQEKRVHMAIIVDEYGGKQGIVTMEDILEEIFGEINDEFDEKESPYEQIDENTFLIDAKMLLNDFYKLTHTHEETFADLSEDAETIGGIILEVFGKIPPKGQIITIQNFVFTIEAADKRKIKKIKVEKTDIQN